MESPEGSSPEGLKGLSTPELMDALPEARKIVPELQARGLAFCRDVLSKVDGFPTAHLQDCTVRIVRDQDGALVIKINIPTYHFIDNESIDARHKRKLALMAALRSLPGVARVEINGIANSGLYVTLRSDYVPPEQGLSQAAEEVLRGAVGESFQRVRRLLP